MPRCAVGIAAAVVLLAQQGSAVAQSRDAVAQSRDIVSANYVMPGCRELVGGSQRELGLQGLCHGIVGIMFNFWRSQLGICFPDGTNVEQAVRVVIRFIDQRPERMHEEFFQLAIEALQQAWPCRR